ncbi:MAG: ABC transporter permease subunit, partial [Ignavibacteriales bacterium]|nr:ABC transporter permease subunit [Ignavibacteriales bacterium]
EYAKESTLARALRFAVNNLAGAPSVVIGLFGFGFFVLFVGQNIDEAAGHGTVFGRPAMLWAATTLATLMTPMIAATTYAALQAARLEDKEAARALGASQWQTVKKVVLPRAFPSIVSGALFTIGRAFGETAPVMFLGAAFFLPQLPVAEVSVFGFDVPTINPMSEFMHLGYHLFTLNTRSVDPSASMAQQYGAAFAMIAVTMFFNVVAFAFRDRFRKFIDRV